MFSLLGMCLYVTSTIATEKDAVEAGMKPGSSALTDMAQARFGLTTQNG